MRMLARIHGNIGYVEVPVEDGVPNPFTTNYNNKPRVYALEMEMTESQDWQMGQVVTMAFKRSEIELLEEA